MSAKPHLARVSASVFLLLTVSGCDPIYGISGRTMVQGSADDACIVAALRDTPGVKGVDTRTAKNDSVTIAGDAPVDGSTIRYFSYNIGSSYYPTLMIEEYSGGRFQYSQTMLQMHEPIPPQEIDHALPVMHQADAHITQRCHVDLSGLAEKRVGG